MPSSQGKSSTLEVECAFGSGANQFALYVEHPIWMAEEEIESGIYEMCDMLLLTKKVSIKKYRAGGGYHDVLQTVYQGQPSYR